MKTMLIATLFSFIVHAEQRLGLSAVDVPKQFEHKGNLVDIRIVPGDKETRLYLVGKEAVRIKIDNFKIKALLQIAGTQKQIEFKRKNDYFQTTEPIQGDLNLRLESIDTNKIDEFKIKLRKD